MTVTVYHNPKCGTSRNVLQMLDERGVTPVVIEYLSVPPDRETLVKMIADAGLTVREALRRKGSPYDELGLDDPKWSDGELIDLMLEHPILINRPFVVTDKGTRLARPKETVLEII
jgi:arsenate reductase